MTLLSHSTGKFIFTKRAPPPLRIDKLTLDRVCGVCQMYNHCFESLKQISTDLIIGLGCSGTLVTKMWYFLRGVMGVNADKVIYTMSSEEQQSLGCVLALFCQITQYLLAYVSCAVNLAYFQCPLFFFSFSLCSV